MLMLGILGCFQPWLVKASDLLWKPDETTYETYLRTRVVEGRKINPLNPFDVHNYVSYTNHEFSYAPLNSSLSNAHWHAEDRPIGYALGAAQVQGLDLNVVSRELPQLGSAQAAAISATTFSSPVEQIVSFELRASGSAIYYTEGFFSLVDVTANRPLWYQYWGFWTDNTIQGFGASRPEPFLTYDNASRLNFVTPRSITLTLETQLFQDHDYRLVMYAQGNANGDSESIFMSVMVPEPTIFSLVSLGLLLLIARRTKAFAKASKALATIRG